MVLTGVFLWPNIFFIGVNNFLGEFFAELSFVIIPGRGVNCIDDANMGSASGVRGLKESWSGGRVTSDVDESLRRCPFIRDLICVTCVVVLLPYGVFGAKKKLLVLVCYFRCICLLLIV